MPIRRIAACAGALALALGASAAARDPISTYALTVTAVDLAAGTVTGDANCAPPGVRGRSQTYAIGAQVHVDALQVGRTVGVQLRPAAGAGRETVVAVVAAPRPGCDGAGGQPAAAKVPKRLFTRTLTLEFNLAHPRGTHFSGRLYWQSLPAGAVRDYVTDTIGDRAISVEYKRATCDEHGAVDACTSWVHRISADGFPALVTGRFVRIGRAPHLLFRARRIVVHTHRPS